MLQWQLTSGKNFKPQGSSPHPVTQPLKGTGNSKATELRSPVKTVSAASWEQAVLLITRGSCMHSHQQVTIPPPENRGDWRLCGGIVRTERYMYQVQ